MKKIIIGYQGIEGSYSEKATLKFKNNLNKDALLRGLITSKKVVDELINNNIDYGVLAIKNSTAGEVIETKNALKNINYEIIDQIDLPIHHCIFKLKNVEKDDVCFIASHIQALEQTKEYRKKYFPNSNTIELSDTSLAAYKLSHNELPKETAVVCSIDAGILNNLDLIDKNIEDKSDNKTTFIIIKII